MHELDPLIRDLAIILGISGLITLLFQKIRQPVVLGYLVAGIIIGPYTAPYALVDDIPTIYVLAELGVIFLMFSLGLEFSFHKLTRLGFSAGITGLIEVLFMALLGFAVGKALGWPSDDSLFLGAALSISSTTIIIKAIDELGLKTKHFAQFVFGVLIIEDLLAILLLVILSTLISTNDFFATGLLLATVKLILVVSGWFLIGYFVIPTLMRKLGRLLNDETLIVVSLGLCLLLVVTAAHFHYSTALGAFIMGSILAESNQVSRIEEITRPIRDIFAAVFFVSIGMLIDPAVIFQHLPLVFLLAVITILGKIISTTLGALLTGKDFTTALRSGFSMAQIGEFSFIIAGLGITLKAVDQVFYSFIVAISAITTFLTPYLIRFSDPLTQTLERRLPQNIKYMLEQYSARFYRILANTSARESYRKAVIRFILNSIILAIIFTVMAYYVLPPIAALLPQDWLAYPLVWLVTVIVASPFLWAMFFGFKLITISEESNSNSKRRFFLPQIIARIFTIIELIILSLIFFENWIVITILLTVTVGFFTLLYNKIERSYYWFEEHLLTNIHQPTISGANLATLDKFTLKLLLIGSEHPAIGHSIRAAQLQDLVPGLIIGLERQGQRILNPDPSIILEESDLLMLVGEEDKLHRI